MSNQYHPVVQELEAWIDKNPGYREKFEQAVKVAGSQGIRDMDEIKTFDDYLKFINDLVVWVPSENIQGKDVYNRLCRFYFVLDQSPVKELQNPVEPSSVTVKATDLSAWMIRYGQAMGQFMDKPESLTDASLQTFKKSPYYNMQEYLEPRGGWRTFNEFFARNFKPGYRPVAAVADQHVIVSPADSTFDGQWEVRADSGVTIKNMHWTISQLLEGSAYKDRFTGGIFMHSFLNTFDYHRQHAPVGGKVLEARTVPGLLYLEVQAKKIDEDHPAFDPKATVNKILEPAREFDAPDSPGYQFQQARGLVVLETAIGLVAVLPIGMAQVSSVIVTAEVGQTLRKGEELSYFQFGGSDIILVFEQRSNVSLTATVGVHYKMGTRIGMAYPEAI